MSDRRDRQTTLRLMVVVALAAIAMGSLAQCMRLFDEIGTRVDEAASIMTSAGPGPPPAAQAQVDRILEVAEHVQQKYRAFLLLTTASAVLALLVIFPCVKRQLFRILIGVPSPSDLFIVEPALAVPISPTGSCRNRRPRSLRLLPRLRQ